MKKTIEEALTRREREVMDIIYARPDQGVGDINKQLNDGSSYSSTRALLARLVDKGHLVHTKHGARYLYRAKADQRQAGSSAIRRVMDTFFGGSPAATIDAVLGFARERLTESERQELLQILEDKHSSSRGEDSK